MLDVSRCSANFLGWTWKHDFTHALDSVVERAFREQGSTYSQIQLLENELLNQPTTFTLAWPDEEDQAAVLGAPGESAQAIRRYMAMSALETGEHPLRVWSGDSVLIDRFLALLHLHRWFFLQAIREKPRNPFEHPFAHSVKTVIATSHKLIRALRVIYTYQPAITAAFRPFWTHAYSAAVRHVSRRKHCTDT